MLLMNVRFEGNNGHDAVTLCLLTHSGHAANAAFSTAVQTKAFACPVLARNRPVAHA